MSAFADRFKSKQEQLPLAIKCLDFMNDTAPSVRDLFLGVFDDAGKQLVKGGSVLLWIDGNRLKCLVNLGSVNEKGWGIIKDPRHLWESLEAIIDAGEIDWKITENTQPESTPY